MLLISFLAVFSSSFLLLLDNLTLIVIPCQWYGMNQHKPICFVLCFVAAHCYHQNIYWLLLYRVKVKAFSMCTYNTQPVFNADASIYYWWYLNSCQMARVQFVFRWSHTKHFIWYAKCLIELFNWISCGLNTHQCTKEMSGLLSNYR